MASFIESSKRFVAFRILVTSACLVVIVAGLKAAESIMVPFVFAVFLSILSSVPLTWLLRAKIPRVFAVGLIALFMLSALSAFAVLLATSVNSFTSSMPQYAEKINQLALSTQDWFETKGIGEYAGYAFDSIQTGPLFDMFGKTLTGLVGALSKILVVLIIMVFILYEATDFKSKFQAALGQRVDLNRLGNVVIDVQRYLSVKTFTSGLTGVLIGFWLFYWDVEFALLWATLAFLLNYIPFIGSLIAAIPAVLLSAVSFGWTSAAIVAVGYMVVNVVVGNFLDPILLGKRLGLSVLVVFLSFVFWGWVWGPMGMLMSVPLTMIVKIFLEHSVELRWAALLMDSKPRGLES